MNRRMVFTGAIPQDLDWNQNTQFAMIGLGFLAEAVFGIPSWAYGLTPSATATPSLTVIFGRGALGMESVVDQTNPGSSAIADTTDPLMKIGINLSSTSLTFVAPSASGQSQVFLIQGQMQETDTGSVVVPYWNPSNPAVPYAGPNNTGAANSVIRAQTVALQVVAGAPASTGSQTIPAATSGWAPLYMITLANGQSTITAGQVVQHPAAPFLPFTLPQIKTFFRIKLLANLTVYVSPAGNDTTGNGSASMPWATLQQAWNTVVSNYDLNGYQVTVSVADGTYPAGVAAAGALVGNTHGVSGLTFLGDAASPPSCFVTVNNGNAFLATNGASYSLSGFEVAATGSASGQGQGLTAFAGGQINVSGPFVFGTCTQAHASVNSNGSISFNYNYSIAGGSAAHWSAATGGSISATSITITMASSTAFTAAFAATSLVGSINIPGVTFSGSATGQRYSAIQNSVINTNGGGATYLPGSTSGSTSSGGQYT